MHDGLGQEWMQTIVVDDFTAFNHAESRADLRRSPFSSWGYPDGDRISAIISGKSITLRRSYANLPILCKIARILIRRTFRNNYDFHPCPPFGKEGQKERKYEHKEFHPVQRYEKTSVMEHFAMYLFDYGAPVGMRLALWQPERAEMQNDPSFIPAGAEAFKRDLPGAVVKFVDSGHFALESHHREIADCIKELLS